MDSMDPVLRFKHKDEITIDKSIEQILKIPKIAVKKTKEGLSIREKEADLILERVKEL